MRFRKISQAQPTTIKDWNVDRRRQSVLYVRLMVLRQWDDTSMDSCSTGDEIGRFAIGNSSRWHVVMAYETAWNDVKQKIRTSITDAIMVDKAWRRKAI